MSKKKFIPDNDPIVAQVADIMRKRLDAYNPCKPWHEQTYFERLQFALFLQFLRSHADVVQAKHPAAAWPSIIIMLRRHGRELPHLLNEWEIDPDWFVTETQRLVRAFEANLNAASEEVGTPKPIDRSSLTDEQLKAIFGHVMAALKKQLASQ